MLFILNEVNSIANDFLRELRDKNIQQDRMRFRKNLERMGEIMAYEISKKLDYAATEVNTTLGKSIILGLRSQPVLLTILRAGIPFFQGFINFFDKADCGFLGAYRQESQHNLTIKIDYVATIGLEGRTVILVDPMLATGRSLMDSIQAVLRHGKPEHIHIVSLIAAPEGLQYLKEKLSIPYSLWTCAVDDKLDENYYIIPGLGDAGDLSYGIKI